MEQFSKKMAKHANGRRIKFSTEDLNRRGSTPGERPDNRPAGNQAEINWRMQKRSHRITLCLLSFVSAICCLTPFTTIHLTQRVGLLLFESDLIQLRSSLICVIICLMFLVIFNTIVYYLGKYSNRKSQRLQSILSKLLGLLAIVSAISYLSLILLVPQIRQVQRMPLASFDCNANLITIENCQQQFTTQNGEQTLDEAIRELLTGDLNGNNERLIKKLNCLKYNNRELETLEVPTRFLLHNCGLICKPHRQQVHQFSDDLNKDQNWPRPHLEESESPLLEGADSSGDSQLLVPPYSRSSGVDKSVPVEKQISVPSQVSMKVCFSDEFDSGSNYKQFCVTNLASSGVGQQGHELTVGQLNAMLRSLMSTNQYGNAIGDSSSESISGKLKQQSLLSGDQATQYVNPVVQFESHFKNWPHLPSVLNSGDAPQHDSFYDSGSAHGESWCKFRPIPPFIVNNKPFSDIQCSIEHEYTMTTGPSLDATRFSGRGADRIYLKKSTIESGETENLARERCNIQCKVNILYQVHVRNREKLKQTANEESINYYLPLKPCVIVSGDGDKTRTSNYYLTFRSTADASLLLAFIMIDCILLLEAIGTKKFQFESNKFRLIGLLLVAILTPMIVAATFDLTVDLSPIDIQSNKSKRESYLVNLFSERLIPWMTDFIRKFSPNSKTNESIRQQSLVDSGLNSSDTIQVVAAGRLATHSIDNFMVPFFFYAALMFILAICSQTLPETSLEAPLVRVSSVEALEIESEQPKANEPSASQSISKSRQLPENKSQAFKVAIFANIVLFMGLQFNLSQSIQTQIFIETFGNPGVAIGQAYAASWFLFGTQTGPLILVLMIVSLFLEEASTFFATFSPFGSSEFIEDPEAGPKRNKIRLLECLTVSLLVYSMRYYFMSGLNPLSKFKWPIVILIQLAEILNFPLTWFAISARAHEIFMEHPIYTKYRKSKRSAAGQSRALDIHILIQTSLAFTFFILARFVALFVHSIHASLHLHSDNIDWFIRSFHHSSTNVDGGIKQNSTSIPAAMPQTRIDSLFSPLPDERQTYMYATRLFMKYNSLICLLIGLSMLLVLVYFKYQIWSENRRTLKIASEKLAHGSGEASDDDLDARLRTDLMQMRATPNTRTIYPRPPPSPSGKGIDNSGPRAKILFHYNLDRDDSSDESNAPKKTNSKFAVRQGDSRPSNKTEPMKKEPSETIIPIAVAEEDSDGSRAGDDEDEEHIGVEGDLVSKRESTGTTTERIVRHRSKRVRIFEDGEAWPSTKIDQPSSGEPLGRNNDGAQLPTKRRTISFAPTTILIDNDDVNSSNSERYAQYYNQESDRKVSAPPNARRASPEPSIGEDNLNDSIEELDSIENTSYLKYFALKRYDDNQRQHHLIDSCERKAHLMRKSSATIRLS